MHRFQGQRFQDEHIQRALDEITGLISHKSPSSFLLPPGKQEENTRLILFVKRRTATVFTLRDTSKGAGRSLRYDLIAPPPASRVFATGVASARQTMV
jgi:hypothetical protein